MSESVRADPHSDVRYNDNDEDGEEQRSMQELENGRQRQRSNKSDNECPDQGAPRVLTLGGSCRFFVSHALIISGLNGVWQGISLLSSIFRVLFGMGCTHICIQ